jgi:hypothetical protein
MTRQRASYRQLQNRKMLATAAFAAAVHVVPFPRSNGIHEVSGAIPLGLRDSSCSRFWRTSNRM